MNLGGDEQPRAGEAGAPAWMATFGDLMSLLLTFFILILSFAHMDVIRFSAAVGSMRDAFGTLQMTPGHLEAHTTSVVDLSSAEATPQLSVLQMSSSSNAAKAKLLRRMKLLIAQLQLQKLVEVEESDRGVVVRVLGELLFDPGSTELRAESLVLLDEIARLVKIMPDPVSIEGHTDDTPAADGLSNWEISAKRAIAALAYLVQVRGIDPARLSVAGFAHVKPLHPNDTAEHREQNRRVEFVFLTRSEEPDAQGG